MKLGDGLFLNICREIGIRFLKTGKQYEIFGIKTEGVFIIY
jgi:hypothetical protein